MRILFILLTSISFFACEKKISVNKPEKLIDEAKMVDIYYDLYILKAIGSVNPMILEKEKITPTSYIYTKYNIDSLQFAQNDSYYAYDIQRYEKIHNQAYLRLLEKKKEVEASKKKTIK